MEVVMKYREIAVLREQLKQANPPKGRKVVQDPNERLVSLAQVASQINTEPSQRVRKPRNTQEVIVMEADESDEESSPVRRSARIQRPTHRYLERDSSVDKKSD